MRRLAFLLVLGTSAFGLSQTTTAAYLKSRSQNGIVQAVGAAALRDVVKPRVFELQGKVVGNCRTGDTTVILFQRADGETQEVETKALPDWLADTNDPVRLLVRCFRPEKGAALRTVLLNAATEIDVLPVEEAYWRGMAAKRRAAEAAKPMASRGGASRGGWSSGGIYGTIGGSSHVSRPRDWIIPPNEAAPKYASFIRGRNPKLNSAQATSIAQALIEFSIRYRIDARLLMSILIVESDFDPNAVSHSGAVGLGQLMPDTARWMGVRNSYDTTDNLYGMVKLLRTHMDQFRTADGSDPLVLAAYNAGEGAVRRHGGVPPYRETQAYVRRVIAIYHQLRGS